MKRLAVILTAMIMIGTSLASMPVSGNAPFGNPTITESRVKTATQKGPALVKLTRIPKPKVFRSNPYRLSTLLNATDTDDIDIDDESKITSYRKRDFGKLKSDPTPEDPEGDITEEIRWKLFLARTAAMIKYNQIHS